MNAFNWVESLLLSHQRIALSVAFVTCRRVVTMALALKLAQGLRPLVGVYRA